MKRIIIWLDSKNEKVDKTLENLKKLLSSTGLDYTIVDVCEISEQGDRK
jgi:hypothetical protein